MVVVGICVGVALLLAALTAIVLLSPGKRRELSGRDLERFEAARASAMLTSQQGHYGGFGI